MKLTRKWCEKKRRRDVKKKEIRKRGKDGNRKWNEKRIEKKMKFSNFLKKVLKKVGNDN